MRKTLKDKKEEMLLKALYDFAWELHMAARNFHEHMQIIRDGTETVRGNDAVVLGTRKVR